jgi:hypothetical protein
MEFTKSAQTVDSKYSHTFGAFIGYSAGKNNSRRNKPPSNGLSMGPAIATLKYRKLSSYGVALTPSTGSANRRYRRYRNIVSKMIKPGAVLDDLIAVGMTHTREVSTNKERTHILTLVSFTILVAIYEFP